MRWEDVIPGSRLAFHIRKPGPEVRFLHEVYGCYQSPSGPALVTGATVEDLAEPARVAGRLIVARGHYVLRHDFLGQWYDLCLFFSPRGDLTGCYCDLQTPLHLENGVARCTDLLLDLWVFAGEAAAHVLDRQEYGAAVRAGWIPPPSRRRAAAALRRLLAAVRRGRFPEALTGARVPPSFLRPRP